MWSLLIIPSKQRVSWIYLSGSVNSCTNSDINIKADESELFTSLSNDHFISASEKDVKALEGYCISYSKFRKANKILAENGFTMTGVNKNGSTYEMQRPEVTIAKNSEDEMRNWMKELGFSPASRARMGKNKKIANSSSVDKDLEDMIS